MRKRKPKPSAGKTGLGLAELWRVFVTLATFTNFLANTLDILEKSGLIS